MSNEAKLVALVAGYAIMIFGLLRHAYKPEIQRQVRRYLKITRSACPKHLADLRKGQLFLVDSSNCPTCKKELS